VTLLAEAFGEHMGRVKFVLDEQDSHTCDCRMGAYRARMRFEAGIPWYN
jgi:hypothetical protein